MPSAAERAAADDRRLRVLADVAHGIDLDGVAPTVRTLAARQNVSYRTAYVDVHTLVAAGLLRELADHQPRQRARWAVTEAGRRTLALATTNTTSSTSSTPVPAATSPGA